MKPGVGIDRGGLVAAGTRLGLRVALPFAAAFAAALAAHLAIDFAGDYLLAHDAYDDQAHGSRWVASLASALAVTTALWAFARALLAETRGSRGALRATLRAALPASRVRFALTVVAAAFPLLLGMAWLDASVAGAAVDGFAALLGGSVPLGAGLTVAFALGFAATAYRGVAVLCRHHGSIVRAMEAFVRLARGTARAPFFVASNTQDRPRVLAALARCTGANRAPPSPVRTLLPA
jgi:hypothetical protein